MERASNPVAWVTWAVYATVLGGGAFHVALRVGSGEISGATGLWTVAALVVAIASAAGLDAVERRLVRRGDRRRAVVVVFVARVLVFAAVIALDASSTARALVVLVPFQAVFAFGVRTGVVVAVACTGFVVAAVARAEPGWYRDPEASADVAMLALGLVLAVSMAAVALRERQARAALEESLDAVARLAAAQERSRLARDIHDSLGHHLTATAIQLQKAATYRHRDPAEADAALDAAQQATASALAEVRRSVRALRDDDAETAPVTGFAALAADGALVEPTVAVQVDDALDHQPASVRSTLLRAAQEGVTNARRHAQARLVRVDVDVSEDQARLTVADDGRGFDPDVVAPGRYGLVGLRERVHLLGGTVDVASSPGTGTVVTVVVPTVPTSPAPVARRVEAR